MEGRGVKFSSALICVSLLGALAIGCGGEGGETVAKQQFVNQANAICEKSLQQRTTAFREAVKEKGSAGLNQASIETFYVEVILPSLARMVDELDELDEPDSGASNARAFVAALEGAIEKAEADPKKVIDGNFDPFLEAEKKATAFELEECSAF